MNKIINVLTSKWLKDKSMTAILIAIIIVIFLAINIAVQILKPGNIDLSENGLYSITKESKEKIAQIPDEDKINIYMFDYDEKDALVVVAKQYEKIKNNINVQVVTVEGRPDLAAAYNVEAGYGTVVFTCGEKNKTYMVDNFYSTDYIAKKNSDISEQRFTNAIIAVSSIGKTTPVYVLTGHNEVDMNSNMVFLSTYADMENYELKSLNLSEVESVPEDCKSILVTSPKSDFSEDETNKMKDYINRGGNLIWLNDSYSATTETPNINSILDLYGVTIRQDGCVVEQDTSRMYATDSPNLIVPIAEELDYINNVMAILFINSGKLEFKSDEELQTLGVKKQEILHSSDMAFFRTDTSIPDFTPQEGEQVGRAVLAAEMDKSVQDGNANSKLIVVANNAFAIDRPIFLGTSQTVPVIAVLHNGIFSLDLIEHATEIEGALKLSKPVNIIAYTADETQDRVVTILIFAYPVLIVIIGGIVWWLRRRKR